MMQNTVAAFGGNTPCTVVTMSGLTIRAGVLIAGPRQIASAGALECRHLLAHPREFGFRANMLVVAGWTNIKRLLQMRCCALEFLV